MSRPAAVAYEHAIAEQVDARRTGLYETESVKDFGLQMERRGVHGWWRKAMGYTGHDERL